MNRLNLHLSTDRLNKDAAPQVQKLVTAAREGSSTAFAQLQSLYSRPVYNTIVRITKNSEDAEDALQDTFLSAFLSLRRFEERSSFYAWLTRIGINSALMILRKRRVRAEIFLDLTSDDSDQPIQFEVKDSAPDPEEICNQRQQYARTLYAIQKLAPSLRRAMLLRATRHRSLKDIARELKISEAAVKSRLHRARALLGP